MRDTESRVALLLWRPGMKVGSICMSRTWDSTVGESVWWFLALNDMERGNEVDLGPEGCELPQLGVLRRLER